VSIVLGPDVFVNASVALGSPPEQVVRRVLGGSAKAKTSKWVLSHVEGMLRSIPSFKVEAVEPQMSMITSLVQVVEEGEFAPGDWVPALVALAKAAGVTRVVTDHPDLADQDPVEGVEFLSSDAWLVEQTTPPPPPGG